MAKFNDPVTVELIRILASTFPGGGCCVELMPPPPQATAKSSEVRLRSAPRRCIVATFYPGWSAEENQRGRSLPRQEKIPLFCFGIRGHYGYTSFTVSPAFKPSSRG